MKKTIISGLIGLFVVTPLLEASVDGRTDHSPYVRPLIVTTRGVVNVVEMPCEIWQTARREKEIHSRLWPVTYLPRLIGNIFLRASSAVNDGLFFPWITPFTDDLSPWTEPFGLPEYPCQVE